MAEALRKPLGVNSVAGNATNINAVNSNKTNIDAVAGQITPTNNISTVASNTANITTVAGISANVTSVAGNSTNINAVAGNAANINTVASNIANVNAVGGNIANVNTVAGISSQVTTVAANVTSVQNFGNVYYGPNATDPATRKDGSALQAGDLYFNTSGNKMRVYTGTGWTDTGTATPVTITTQTLSGTGSQTVYTLSTAPAFPAACEVFISGVAQVTGVDFTVSGTTLTFTTAPPAGTNNIFVRVVSAYGGGVPNDGSVTAEKLASSLSSTLATKSDVAAIPNPVAMALVFGS